MKSLVTTVLVGSALLPGTALAQQTMYVAGYSGDYQTFLEREIFPAFAEKHNVNLVYVAGNSSETLAKLQAQKGNQEISVAIVDDGPMQQAIQFGYCDPVADAAVYGDAYGVASTDTFDGKAIGFGLVAAGLTYNTESFEQNGWAAPTSWNDLTDPKFKQRVTSNPISGTYGLSTLIMFARINGGSEEKIEPGFEAVREKLAPNVLSWSASNAQLAQMFQSGDVDLAVWGNARAVALKNTGFPVEFVYPAEGSPVIVATACAIAGNKLPEQSQAFLQYLATPEVQEKLAVQGFGPANRKAKLEGDLAQSVPYGEAAVSKLLNIDWPVVNQNRAAWTDEWNRTVER